MDPTTLLALLILVLHVPAAGGRHADRLRDGTVGIRRHAVADRRAGRARAIRPDRLRHRGHLQSVGRPDVRADGLPGRRGRTQRSAVPRLQRLARPPTRRAGAGDDRRLRRLRRDLRVEPRHGRDDGADRAARDAPLQLRRPAGYRRGRCRRHDRHPDPAQHDHGDLRSADRDQHLAACFSPASCRAC